MKRFLTKFRKIGYPFQYDLDLIAIIKIIQIAQLTLWKYCNKFEREREQWSGAVARGPPITTQE